MKKRLNWRAPTILSVLLFLSVLVGLNVFGATVESPIITNQPPNMSVAVGGLSIPLRVEAETLEEDQTLEYQWYSASEPDGSDKKSILGAVSSTYTPKVSLGSTYYSVAVRAVTKDLQYSDYVFSDWVEVSYYEVSEFYLLEIESLPKKLVYYQGESIDLEGLKVQISCDGDVSLSEDGAFLVYSRDPLITKGEQMFWVGYENTKVSFVITVKETPEIATDIEIVSLPEKTEYEVGETLSLEGLSVQLLTNLGGRLLDAVKDCRIEPTLLSEAGEQEITVTYGEFSAAFTVLVKAPEVSTEDSTTAPETTKPEETKPSSTTNQPQSTAPETTEKIVVTDPTRDDIVRWALYAAIGVAVCGIIVVLIVSSKKKKTKKSTKKSK